jgi:hypothetical protein
MRKLALLPALSAVLLAGACDGAGRLLGSGRATAPQNVDAVYLWTLDGWEASGTRPIGHPTVLVTWEIPTGWSGEPFRVYARRSDQSGYSLAATVTSCSASRCAYTDRNLTAGQSYDYFVVAYDEGTRRELESSAAVRIAVPAPTSPQTPAGVAARSLDNGVFLTWSGSGAQRYVVYLQDAQGLVTVGETDGKGYVDQRAQNGSVYQYRVAAVDTLGHYSVLSALATGVPRPDFHAESIFAYADSARLSGFRFPTSEASDPLLSGDAAAAQWRLELTGGTPQLRPLGSTQVTAGEFTSELTCGPGSDVVATGACTDVPRAPAASAFQTAAVPASSGFTYVFRVTGDDGRVHYGKVRVLGAGKVNGRNVLIFDWAYQLRPDETSLYRAPG